MSFISDALEKGTPEIVVGLCTFAITSAYGWSKRWFQQGSPREKQLVLTLEANRLLKLHETLARTSEPSAKVTKAQATVENQLNQVLENLAHLLTEPQAATTHSPVMAGVGKYLLFYGATGIVSSLMHWIFYLLLLMWALIVGIGFQSQVKGAGLSGADYAIAAVLLIPVIFWNYLTRKVDGWLRSRQSAASPATAVAASK